MKHALAGSEDVIQHIRVMRTDVSDRTLWRYLCIDTSDGYTGLGEITLDSAPPDMEELTSEAGASLVGKRASATSLGQLHQLLDGDIAEATIYSGLEQALVDLEAQHAGLPIHRFLNPLARPNRVDLYANINRRTRERRPEDFAESALSAKAEQFRAVKLAPFDDVDPANCEAPEGECLIGRALDRVAAVADAVGADTGIFIDCHWRFTTRVAAEVIPALARLGVSWIECPIEEARDRIPDLLRLRRLANDNGVRLAGLESERLWSGFAPFVEAGAYDVIMPDVKHAGGCRAIQEISARAADHGVSVSLHNPSGPVAHLASVQLMTALGGGEYLEVQWDESPAFFSQTDPAPSLSGGFSEALKAPGLGAVLLPAQQETAGASR